MKTFKQFSKTCILFSIVFFCLLSCGGGSTDYNFEQKIDLSGVINAPSNLTANPGLPGTNMIRIDWKDNSINEKGFQIEYRNPLIVDDLFVRMTNLAHEIVAEPENAVSSETFYSPDSVGVELEFRIKAFSGKNESPYSNIGSAAIP